jgi:hypothetical protein
MSAAAPAPVAAAPPAAPRVAQGERYKELSKEHDVRKTNIIAGACRAVAASTAGAVTPLFSMVVCVCVATAAARVRGAVARACSWRGQVTHVRVLSPPRAWVVQPRALRTRCARRWAPVAWTK